MAYNISEKFDFVLFMKTFFIDCLKKIFKNNRIFNKEIPSAIVKNEIPIYKLSSEENDLIFESFSEICYYNHDFSILTNKFITQSYEPKNVANLIKFIKGSNSGYYVVKAKIILILKLLLMILLLSLSMFLIYPKNEGISVDSKNYKIFKIKKYKITIKITTEMILRIAIFFIFDLNFIVGEFLFLTKLERKKNRAKYSLIFLQITKYILTAIIYINKLLLLRNKGFNYDDSIFYKNNNIINFLFQVIMDLIKFIIK